MDSQTRSRQPQYPGFSLAERDRRWKLARDLMDEQGVDALLVAGERNMDVGAPLIAPDNYLTNDRPGALVVVPREGEPVCLVWSAQVVAAHAQGQRDGGGSWVRPENMWVGRTPERLAHIIKSLRLEKGRIGVIGLEPAGPGGEGFLSYFGWNGILAALPDVTFKPVWRRFVELMSIKSAEEIAALRQAADAGERMCEALLDAARPGVSENELYATALVASFRAGAPSSWMILQTGPDNTCWGPPDWLFRPIKPRVVEDGDLILTELFPSYGLVEVQQQLAIAVGKVHPTVEKCADIARRAYEAGLKVCRPGTTFGELADAMVAPVRESGGWFLTPQVHSLNPITVMVSVAADGVHNMINSNRYPKIEQRPERDRDVVLQPGMTFAFETNCHLDHRRVNIGGTVLVTENGAEELNTLANNMQRV
jgi:Xaa-Pro dipeptidase